MFELLMFMIATSVQSAGSSGLVGVPPQVAETPAAIAAAPSATELVQPQPDTVAEPEVAAVAAVEVAPPAFLAPPATLVAEPQVATGRFTTALEVRPILEATSGNWVTVREFNGQDLVYVTHLWSWRCGLVEMRVGINGAPPEVWPLPPCHEQQPSPNMILESDGLPYRPYTLGSVGLIEVQLTYDDLSTVSAAFERAAVMTP